MKDDKFIDTAMLALPAFLAPSSLAFLYVQENIYAKIFILLSTSFYFLAILTILCSLFLHKEYKDEEGRRALKKYSFLSLTIGMIFNCISIAIPTFF